MRIEMLKMAAGPDGTLVRGGVYELPEQLARNLIEADGARPTTSPVNMAAARDEQNRQDDTRSR